MPRRPRFCRKNHPYCWRKPGADIDALKQSVFGRWIETTQQTVPPQDALTAELADFLECVRTDREPLVNGETAIEALAAAERVLAEIASHQWEGHPGGAIGPHLITAPAIPLRKAG